MRLADACLVASLFVVVIVVAKMLRAIRLLDGRVSLLQEQLVLGREKRLGNGQSKPIPLKLSSSKTPMPIVPTRVSLKTPPIDAPVDEVDECYLPGESTPIVIEQAEADAVWARIEAEQERLKKAMGRDFQVRQPNRPAMNIRGTPIQGSPIAHSLSSQELARKLQRK